MEAARKAAAHDMIVNLPEGYDTRVRAGGGRLSGGQMQRIGLARALYGDPVIVILDEPNSNLDNEGSMALNNAIKRLKSEGKSVLIMAHRPAAIQECDKILVIDQGTMTAFGPKDEVLRKMVANHRALQPAAQRPSPQAAPQPTGQVASVSIPPTVVSSGAPATGTPGGSDPQGAVKKSRLGRKSMQDPKQ